MTLEDGIVRLRAVEPSDLENLYQWENDISIWKVSQTISPFSKYTLKEYCAVANTDIYTARQVRLMIDYKENDTIISVGMVDLFEFDPIHRRAGIGVLIGNENFRKKGIANSAIKLIVNYAFSILNLHQVHCYISENNNASIELFKKLDFVVCGIIKDWLLNSNQWENVLFLQRINK
jgi:diamine N-acetyltransferase